MNVIIWDKRREAIKNFSLENDSTMPKQWNDLAITSTILKLFSQFSNRQIAFYKCVNECDHFECHYI